METRLLGLGFRAKLRDQLFSRMAATSSWLIHISFADAQSRLDATLDLAIRSTAAQRRLTRVGFGVPEGATMGAELGNIIDGRPRRWTLLSETDCESVAHEMYDCCESFAINWFRRYESDDAILDVLSSGDDSAKLYSPVAVKRFLSILALAQQVWPETRVRQLVTDYHRALTEQKDPQLSAFAFYSSKMLQEL